MIQLPASKFLIIETEQVTKFVNELNQIKESWEMRLLNLEDRIRKLEKLKGKVAAPRA